MSDEDINGAATQQSGPAEKPTLKTISRLSGLAVPTVSRALNDAPDINVETKKLVRRIADEIGYIPNRAGVRLRTGRTNVISLVLSTEHDMMNHTAKLISAVAANLRNTPFHLNVTPYFPDEDPMRPIRYIVETRSADAIIINQTQARDPRVAYLMEHNFPFVTHGRTDWADKHPYFDYDNTAWGRIGVKKLASRGRKNILLIAPPRMHFYAMNMVEGASAAAAELGLKMRVSDVTTSDDGFIRTGLGIIEEFRADPTIDGVICGSTNAAMGVTSGLESIGLNIGAEVDIFAKEAIPFLNLFRKEIISLHEDVWMVGEFAARAAMQAIREPELPPMQGLEVPTDDQVGL